MDEFGKQHVLTGNIGRKLKILDKVRVHGTEYCLVRCHDYVPHGFDFETGRQGIAGWDREEYNVLLSNGKPCHVVGEYGDWYDKITISVDLERPLGKRGAEKALLKLSGIPTTEIRVTTGQKPTIRVSFIRSYYRWEHEPCNSGYYWRYCPLFASYEFERVGNHFSIHELRGCHGW